MRTRTQIGVGLLITIIGLMAVFMVPSVAASGGGHTPVTICHHAGPHPANWHTITVDDDSGRYVRAMHRHNHPHTHRFPDAIGTHTHGHTHRRAQRRSHPHRHDHAHTIGQAYTHRSGPTRTDTPAHRHR
jgi:hypothetical protein